MMLCSNKNDYIIIPDNAIRFRIVANSNNIEDQRMKYRIKNDITPLLEQITNNANSYSDVSKKIEQVIPGIKKIIDSNNINYQINYGSNYFPEKVYNNIKYPAGNYESLVITLGDGLGDNWWCVLFPPLCLIENKKDQITDYEYSLFIKDIINSF